MAKAATWTNIDTEARKRGEQTGLDTLVVHALNDANWMLGEEYIGIYSVVGDNVGKLTLIPHTTYG